MKVQLSQQLMVILSLRMLPGVRNVFVCKHLSLYVISQQMLISSILPPQATCTYTFMLQFQDIKYPLGLPYIKDHIYSVLVQPILDADDNVMGKLTTQRCIIPCTNQQSDTIQSCTCIKLEQVYYLHQMMSLPITHLLFNIMSCCRCSRVLQS